MLGALDDKIDLNRRMNDTLAAMARALFTSWFIDFEPVRAKLESRDTGLPKRIAALFPDRFVMSKRGAGRTVPRGWQVGALSGCRRDQQRRGGCLPTAIGGRLR